MGGPNTAHAQGTTGPRALPCRAATGLRIFFIGPPFSASKCGPMGKIDLSCMSSLFFSKLQRKAKENELNISLLPLELERD